MILIVHEKCEPRPGLTNIQCAEANINHGFSTTEVLSDITKLVSMTQLCCSTLLNVSRRRRGQSYSLSGGKPPLSPTSGRFVSISVPYLTPHLFQGISTVPTIGMMTFIPGPKGFFFFSFLSFSPSLLFFPSSLSLSFLFFSPLSLSLLFFLFSLSSSPSFSSFSPSPSSHLMKPITIVKRFLKGEAPSIPLPPGTDDEVVSNPSTESWLLISQSSTRQRAHHVASTKEAECQTRPAIQPFYNHRGGPVLRSQE